MSYGKKVEEITILLKSPIVYFASNITKDVAQTPHFSSARALPNYHFKLNTTKHLFIRRNANNVSFINCNQNPAIDF